MSSSAAPTRPTSPPPREDAPSPVFELLVLSTLAVVLYLPTIFGRGLWEFDEFRWASVARNLLDTRNWWEMRLLGNYYPDKPPLYFWMQAWMMSIAGGPGDIAPRLVNFFAVMFTGWITWGIGRHLVGGRAGFLAAVLYMTAVSPGALATSIALDPFYTMWVAGAIAMAGLGAMDGLWNWRRGAVLAVCVAAAVFTKGPVGLGLILAAMAMAGALGVGVPRGAWWSLGAGVLLSLGISGVWLANCAANPEIGVDGVLAQFSKQVTKRAVQGVDHRNPVYFFLYMMWVDAAPGAVLFPAAFAAMASLVRGAGGWRGVRVRLSENRGPAYAFAWFLGILLLHSIGKEKRGTYILPSFPGLFLLVGWVADRAGRGVASVAESRALGVARVVAVVGLVVFGGFCGYRAISGNPVLEQRLARLDHEDAIDDRLTPIAAWQTAVLLGAGGLALTLAGYAAGRLGRGRRGIDDAGLRAVVPVAGMGALVLVVAGAVVAPQVDAARSGAKVAALLLPWVNDTDVRFIFREKQLGYLLSWRGQTPRPGEFIDGNTRATEAFADATGPALLALRRDKLDDVAEALPHDTTTTRTFVYSGVPYVLLGRNLGPRRER